MSRRKLTRRQFVAATAATSAALVTAPYVRSAFAAGKLTMGFWQHWVPGADKASKDLVNEWAAKEKVEVSIDYIPSQGNKNLLTIAAEGQAKSGHDILSMPTWWPHANAEMLEPVNDIMEPLIKQNGKVNGTVQYLGKRGDKWLGVPSCVGSQIKGPCSRIDLLKQHAKIDIQEMYPAGAEPKDEGWTTEVFLKAAEACHKAGVPFGIGLGETTDSVDAAGAFFQAFGAQLVNDKGDVTVKTDEVRQVLEFYKKLMAFLPPDVTAWDDASNNKWLVSGRGAMIMNPPSAWAVAKRDAPQIAEQLWTHGFPKGPKGRYAPFLPYFWSIWSFSKNKEAAKSLLVYLSRPESIEKLVEASGGYDLPAFENLTKLKVWAEAEPPKGTLFSYPDPYHRQTLSIAASPAPPKIAQQIYAQGTLTKMCVKYYQGESMENTLAWAEGECEGFMRS
ncbi:MULTISPECIES: extracellular solute-binding protein [Rhodopseudomonas]|uniref:ABC transporter substrate-binding protein n=1 Tax=Rhodopseudomonas palustris TaxID=1076 RepID=A0A0D7EKS7_RHOPL|nr:MULTISPECIES: extracellular solute-binding protein [Rhodopseudomonas]KIZ41155.1 ABC transporter substrate-binding protein [Rhodopseudomonas palustris]MDF3812655.1 extracellular solute-binding protein [Rhodopseudomonas sp. BAL398]WOK18920.1 extracellular solute-binding protein [Rhodopseudomonas sp. BAL398]